MLAAVSSERVKQFPNPGFLNYICTMSEEEKAPKPVFHFGENFSSAYFGKLPDDVSGAQDPATDHKLINNFISLLTNPAQREHKAEALAVIRNAGGQQFLVDLLRLKEYEKYQKELVMACWESGLDFSQHLIFFAELAANCGYPVALEAITVIDEMLDIKDDLQRANAIEILSNPSFSSEKQVLFQEVLSKLGIQE